MSKWEMVRLGDVCSIVTGTTPKTTVSEYWNGTLDWITPAELKDNSYVVAESERKITEKAVTDTSLKSFPEGTVILSSRAPIGKVAIAGKEMYCNQGFKNLICSKIIINYYLYWFLKSKTVYLNSLGRGATFKEISKSILEKVEIPLPSLAEQQKIADTLDKVSHLIALRKEQLNKLDLLVKVKFVEMFGDPVENPMGWTLKTISDCLLKIENGKSYVCSNESRTGELPAILKLSAVTYGTYNPLENKAVDSKLFASEKAVCTDDLLFTRKNTPELVGMAAYVFDTPNNLMMPDLIFRLVTKECCNKIYLWQLINHDMFRPQIAAIAGGSAKSMSNISKERLGNLGIPLPPLTLQTQFADYVTQVETAKKQIQQGLEKLEVLYRGLMQEYFE